jgi:hypothetical protein
METEDCPWNVAELRELLAMAKVLGFQDDVEYFKKELAKAGK